MSSLITHITEATLSCAIWQIFEELFAAKSQAWTMQVKIKNGFDSITDYYHRAKLLQDSLAMASKTMFTFDFITFLLVGFGSNYDL